MLIRRRGLVCGGLSGGEHLCEDALHAVAVFRHEELGERQPQDLLRGRVADIGVVEKSQPQVAVDHAHEAVDAGGERVPEQPGIGQGRRALGRWRLGRSGRHEGFDLRFDDPPAAHASRRAKDRILPTGIEPVTFSSGG